jgi:Carbohydrate binding domain
VISAINSTLGNIILNHDFSDGMKSWKPRGCHAYVASDWSGFLHGIRGHFGENYAVVTNRDDWRQGLEQNITDQVKFRIKYYYFFALVRTYGEFEGPVIVKATIELKDRDATKEYLTIARR